MRAAVGEGARKRIASNPSAVKMLKNYNMKAKNITKLKNR